MNTKETLYYEPSYFNRLRAMAKGLRMPRNSREYKEACIELQRLTAPLSAIVLPALAVGVLLLLGAGNAGSGREIVVEVLEDWEAAKVLEDIPKPETPPEPQDTLETTITIDTPVVTDVVQPADKISPQPQTIDAVLNIKSPVVLKGIPGVDRSTSTRVARGKIHGWDPRTEDAVLCALRWLKHNQSPDGSWGGNRIAMTGLAVLSFLAHGETPGKPECAEFGDTVQKALEYLMSKQGEDGRFAGRDSHDYSHPIATYALCEAYGMTLHPNVLEAAGKALAPIIKGQHPTGGWTYNMNPGADEGGKYRDDTSYMGWCAQALKAAKLSEIKADGLDKAMKLAVNGFKANAAPGGGFGYTEPGGGGMTAVGTLCMQLLGAAGAREVKLSLDLMKPWKPSFAEKEPNVGGSMQYYHYYATQCKFHASGGKDKDPQWDKWNDEMKDLYTTAQKITKGAYQYEGKDYDIGWWENKDNHTDRPVMDTCLTALQLMVYYRHLPTTSVAAVKPIEEALKSPEVDKGDIEVFVTGL